MHNNEKYLLNIPELLKGSRIRFSKGGWFLMSKCMTVCLCSSTIHSQRQLSGFQTCQILGYDLPTASDCLVFAIDKDMFSNQVHIFFIKRGEKHWSYNLYSGSYLLPNMESMDFELTLNNPVFYHGKFYCLDHNGTLGVFKYGHPNASWEILSMVTPPNCGFIYNSFLVECEGKLLSVLLGRLEVRHLGKHMLFLSITSCISAPPPTSQMENKIYFPRLHNEGILYYSLDTCRGRYYTAAGSNLIGQRSQIELNI